jgi:hypothetical protein
MKLFVARSESANDPGNRKRVVFHLTLSSEEGAPSIRRVSADRGSVRYGVLTDAGRSREPINPRAM